MNIRVALMRQSFLYGYAQLDSNASVFFYIPVSSWFVADMLMVSLKGKGESEVEGEV